MSRSGRSASSPSSTRREPTAPHIDFVLGGDPNVPNGGLFARFPGLYIPILDFSLNGPEPTDTPFDTVIFARQYDGIADFPLYPLNLVADPERGAGLLLRAHLPVRRQPGSRPVHIAVLSSHSVRRYQLLLLRDARPAVIRAATRAGGA